MMIDIGGGIIAGTVAAVSDVERFRAIHIHVVRIYINEKHRNILSTLCILRSQQSRFPRSFPPSSKVPLYCTYKAELREYARLRPPAKKAEDTPFLNRLRV
jgi:hypothetical protein